MLVATTVLAAVVLVPLSIILPFGGLVLGPALAAGGIAGRRRASRPLARAAATAAVVLGAALLAIGLLLLLGYSTGSGTDIDSGS